MLQPLAINVLFDLTCVNCSVKREKAYTCFLDDLKRCELLGLTLYNFQSVNLSYFLSYSYAIMNYVAFSPGSTVGSISVEDCLSLIAECLNRAHKATDRVITVIENMVSFVSSFFACNRHGR